jgi:hypothetical protein
VGITTEDAKLEKSAETGKKYDETQKKSDSEA